jgi:uncharacterized protein YndB with AHSA1/START domain
MNATSAAAPIFAITRRVAAPRDLVWRVWTDVAHLAHWWGPKGCTITHSKLDFRPGGTFHYAMAFAGTEMWGLFRYQEVTPPERIVFLNSFSDRDGGIARAPFPGAWPTETLTTVTMNDLGGETEVAVTSDPYNATDLERTFFVTAVPSLTGGWTGTFERLETYLKNAAA